MINRFIEVRLLKGDRFSMIFNLIISNRDWGHRQPRRDHRRGQRRRREWFSGSGCFRRRGSGRGLSSLSCTLGNPTNGNPREPRATPEFVVQVARLRLHHLAALVLAVARLDGHRGQRLPALQAQRLLGDYQVRERENFFTWRFSFDPDVAVVVAAILPLLFFKRVFHRASFLLSVCSFFPCLLYFFIQGLLYLVEVAFFSSSFCLSFDIFQFTRIEWQKIIFPFLALNYFFIQRERESAIKHTIYLAKILHFDSAKKVCLGVIFGLMLWSKFQSTIEWCCASKKGEQRPLTNEAFLL